jgi:PAS domain S-box-containing protein
MPPPVDDRIHILYVDDSRFDRELVRHTLEVEHGGFRLTEAGSRREFEARLTEARYDLILSDFNIRGYEGFDVLEAVQALNPDIPVLIVTGTGSEEVAVEAMKRGVTDYVIKTPRHIQRLPATILAALEKKRLQREREQAEALRRQSEERYRTLIEAAPDVIFTLDLEGNIASVNSAFETITGYRREDWIGQPYARLVHPDDLVNAADIFQQLLQGEVPSRYELRILVAAGTYLYAEYISRPLYEGDQVVGVFGIARNVTERKEYEHALMQAKERAEEMSRLKSAFLTNISHEIRTPLTGIIGFSSILASEVSPEHREFIQHIETSGKRLLNTFNSILDLSLLEAGQHRMSRTVLNLVEEVRERVSTYQSIAIEKGLTLAFHTSNPVIPIVLDVTWLDRILTNLIGNALKFTQRGGVTVEVQGQGSQVEIRVQDTGVGISPMFMPRLFEPFKQENMEANRPYEGIGIGLAITRQLVELMGGHIQVQSAKHEGTTFCITFPLQQVALPVPTVAGTTRRSRVLAVEDNPEMLLIVKHFLSERYDVETALDEETALALARQSLFDVVLMDVNLGQGRTGLEVMRAIRQLPGYVQVPFLAVTAYALPQDREHLLREGFDAHIGKPFTKPHLREILAQVLARRER